MTPPATELEYLAPLKENIIDEQAAEPELSPISNQVVKPELLSELVFGFELPSSSESIKESEQAFLTLGLLVPSTSSTKS